MRLPNFLSSIRAKLLLVSLVLLLIPLIGFRFVKEMEGFLGDGQQQVLLSAARFLSASLSNRPDLLGNQTRDETADEIERRRLLSTFGNRDLELLRALGDSYRPSETIERLLAVGVKDASRIWVVDSHMVVRGLEGNLNGTTSAAATPAKPDVKAEVKARLQSTYQSVTHPLLSGFIKVRDGPLIEDADEVKRSVLTQIDRALAGQSSIVTREARNSSGSVQSAAQPVWQDDDIVGAVVIEESDQSTRAIQLAALEALLAMTLVVFIVGFVVLMTFAWRLAFRVRRLQAEAERAIDNQGRIMGAISGADSRDEIGALATTLEDILGRLKRYNSYLEQMASRLAHELRTPVAVVRSSLDNLSHADIAAPDRVYIARAEEGIKRLSSLISRMSEASQLEQFLQGAEKEQFDLQAVAAGCVEGYRLAYAARDFTFHGTTATIHGVPDAIAQLLDKLVQNANDFATLGTPIVVSVLTQGKHAQLSVQNQGRTIPDATLSQLFTSMVSSRDAANVQDGHLGLGLFIVQLVAEFHDGEASAMNLAGGGGVRFEVRFNLA